MMSALKAKRVSLFRRYQLDLCLMRHSVTLVTFDCIRRAGSLLTKIYSQIPSQSVLIETLSGIEASSIDHPE
jgi:hypothetical protein